MDSIILNDINGDTVDSAYRKLCLKLDKNNAQISGRFAYSILVTLNKLVSSAMRCKTSCKSKCQDIYNVAEICCKTGTMWREDQTGCMQCVYHVMRYLLTQSELLLSQQLCRYFFSLKKSDCPISWTEKESAVLYNSISYYNVYLSNINNEIVALPESKKRPVVFWFQFILSLNELNDFSCTTHMFMLFHELLKRSSNQELFSQIVISLVNEFRSHLTKLSVSINKWQHQKDILLFVKILIWIISKDTSDDVVSCLLGLIDIFKRLLEIYQFELLNCEEIELLAITLKMFTANKEEVLKSDLNLFYKYLKNKNINSIEVCIFINILFREFRSKIHKLLFKEDNNLETMLSSLHNAYTKVLSKGFATRREQCELFTIISTSMDLLINSKVGSTALKSVFKIMKTYFGYFNKLIQGSNSIFQIGVVKCLNVIYAYHDLELFQEAGRLSGLLLKYIFAINQELLQFDTFETNLEHILNLYTTSLGKIGLSIEALVMLLAFAGIYPEYIEIAFKYWANIKVNYPTFNLQANMTSYDLLTKEKKTIEKEWAPCKVDSINVGKFLLAEIKAYSKHRELQVDPVFAAYKAAFGLVKDKLVLAQILTAVVDAVSSDKYILKQKNLFLSLENIYAKMKQLKEQTTEKEMLCQINCITGDLLYQEMRCEMVHIRKKAEEEITLMDSSITSVPIVDGSEVQESVTPYAHSYLKSKVQTQLATKMFKALNAWKEAAEYATEADTKTFNFRYLKGLAYLFRLYCYKSKEVEMWKVIYKIAKLISNEHYKVLAVAELLSIVVTVDPEWVEDARITVNNTKLIPKKSYVRSLFSCCLGMNFYLNGKVEEALNVICELDEQMLKRHFLVYARYKILLFLLTKDDLKLAAGKPEGSIYNVKQVFENILFLIKQSKWKTFAEKCVLEWLLFELSMLNGKICFDMRLVRHTRCHGKAQLKSAQALALPIRVCQFLSLLVNSNIITGDRIQANLLFDSLDTILDLDRICIAECDDNDPGDCIYKQTTSENDISVPKCLSHESNCSCLFCSNIDYLTVMLSIFTLKMLYTSSAGSSKLANHICKIGKEIINFVNKKEELSFSHIVSDYDETKTRFYLGLSFVFVTTGEIKEALDWTEIALKTVKNRDTLLEKEILYQSVALQARAYEQLPQKTYKPELFADNYVPPENAKTPEMKPFNSIMKAFKSTIASQTGVVNITPRPMLSRKVINFEDESKEKFENGDKETANSPEGKHSSYSLSPLAYTLPSSGCGKNDAEDKIKPNEQKTPQVAWGEDISDCLPNDLLTRTRSRTARFAKKLQKPISKANDFSTPLVTKVPTIKIFCDDDDDDDDDRTKTCKTRGRKKVMTTQKKTVTKSNKKKQQNVIGKKFTFESDSDEEIKLTKLGRKLFCDNDIPTDNPCSDIEAEKASSGRDSVGSNDCSIIEATMIEHTNSKKLCLPLTPVERLGKSLEMISISGKKYPSLSTRKMTKLKSAASNTPTSSIQVGTSSRINIRSKRL